MNHTEAIITLDMSPVGTREKASFGDGDRMPWVKWESLVDDDDRQRKLGTGEPGLFKLDGSYRLFPDDPYNTPYMGYYSPYLSDGDGVCPYGHIEILFSDPVTTNGLTLCFGDTMAKDFKVVWYSGNGGGSTTTKTVTGNTEQDRYISGEFVNCSRITIDFLKTDAPYRYVKLREIVFGRKDRLALTAANILTEFDPMCNSLSIGTLSMTALNTDQRYNMLNPDGVYHDLQQNQRVIVRELVQDETGEEEYQMGKYYLESWENSNSATAKLTAVDVIGLFDSTPYDYAALLIPPKSTPAKELFQLMFATAEFDGYTIDDEIGTTPLSGMLPTSGTVRTALQHLCIATRSALKVNRDGSVRVYRPKLDADPIPISKQISRETLTQKTSIEQIGVKWYVFPDEVENEYPKGLKTYIEKNTLITSEEQAKEIADYWNQYLAAYGLELSYRMVLDPKLDVGNAAEITTAMQTQLPHLLTSLDIDLTGGFLASAKGVSNLVAATQNRLDAQRRV